MTFSEQGEVEASILEALGHAEPLEVAAEHLDPRVQLVEPQVGHVSVRVVDQDLRRPCVECAEGRGVGLFVAAGPDAGILEYRIDDGPVRTLDTFTRWSTGLNLPWAYVLEADLAPGRHTLSVRIAEHTNAQSKGHALNIRNLLVNE